MYDPEVLQRSIDHYREALVKAGHDPATREVLGKFHMYVMDSERQAVAEAGSYLHNKTMGVVLVASSSSSL